ncbi:MAG: FHA domain-containing protein [Crocosphaera sp.]
MIILTLLHPTQTISVQTWTFETTSTIRIGRSMENEVVLYSAVVSRHHLEIRYEKNHWEVVNLGTNGTYVDGELISQKRARDGTIIRLASSGPKIQIQIIPEESPLKSQLAPIKESQSSPSVQQKKSSVKDTRPEESS